MILVLDIEKLANSVYWVHYSRGGVEVTAPTQHGSISEALAFCGDDIPAGFSQYVEVQYSGVNSGTIAVARLRNESSQLAAELVSMVAEVAAAQSVA